MMFIDNLMFTLKRLKTSVSTVDGTLVGDGSGSMVVYCCGASGPMCAISKLIQRTGSRSIGWPRVKDGLLHKPHYFPS